MLMYMKAAKVRVKYEKNQKGTNLKYFNPVQVFQTIH